MGPQFRVSHSFKIHRKGNIHSDSPPYFKSNMATSKGIQIGWLGTLEQGSLSLSFQQGLKHQQAWPRLTCIHEPWDLGADHAQLQPVREQQGLLRGVNQKSSGEGLFLREPYIQ